MEPPQSTSEDPLFKSISLHTSYMSGVGLKVREGESACTVMLC